MSVLLVNAKLKNIATELYPPLGIGYLASVLRNENISVSILDMAIDMVTDIDNIISKYEIIGIYFNTANYSEALSIARKAKKLGKMTILGGPHASFNAEECMLHREVDYILVGEGEKCFLNLVKKLLYKQPVDNVPSLVYRKNEKIIFNKMESLIDDLDSIPFPARDLIPMTAYRSHTNDTSIIASRGCPYSCKFCAGTLMGRHMYRKRNEKFVIQEIIEIVSKYGFERITFFDDIFTADRNYVLNICEQLKKEQLGIKFSCQTRVNYIDNELLKNMREAGFDKIFFGVESGNQNILNMYDKKIKLSNVEQAVEQCKKNNIRPFLSFIIGLPEDTKETIIDSINFAIKLQVNDVWFQPFTPFPGTIAFKEALENGLINKRDFIENENYNLRTVVTGTKYLSIEEVRQLYIEAILSVYNGELK